MAGDRAPIARNTGPCPSLSGPAGRNELELRLTVTQVPPKPQVSLGNFQALENALGVG